MELTILERRMLSNQYKILEKVDPEEAEYYQRNQKILDNGYEYHYDEIIQFMSKDDYIMTTERCTEVIDILEMFAMMKRAYDRLEDKSGLDEDVIRFAGFDGNEEAYEKAYADFVLFHQDSPRFTELEKNEGLNSHAPLFENYRRMLVQWKKSIDKYVLTKDDLLRISTARPYPKD